MGLWGDIAAWAEVGQVSVMPEDGLEWQDVSAASGFVLSHWQGAIISHSQGEVVRVQGVWDRQNGV